jgi:two-component system KDP operon response regulator KdpE
MKVLIVEDHPEISALYTEAFKARGWDVECAESGAEALKMLAESTPTVVVLDLFLPRGHGIEVLSEMKSNPRYKKIPVIVVSGRLSHEEIDAAKGLGAEAILHKTEITPFDLVQTAQKLTM